MSSSKTDIAAIVTAVLAAMAKPAKAPKATKRSAADSAAASPSSPAPASAASKKPKPAKAEKSAATAVSASASKRASVYAQWLAWIQTLTAAERTTLLNALDICCFKSKDECPHYDSDIDAESSSDDDSDGAPKRKTPINPKAQAVLNKLVGFYTALSQKDYILLLDILKRCCLLHHRECKDIGH
jgi:hypothetical protein